MAPPVQYSLHRRAGWNRISARIVEIACRSKRTGIDYPIAFRVEAGHSTSRSTRWLDDQELDSRASVGTCTGKVRCARLAGGRQVGRGYLELTGYGGALKI